VLPNHLQVLKRRDAIWQRLEEAGQTHFEAEVVFDTDVVCFNDHRVSFCLSIISFRVSIYQWKLHY